MASFEAKESALFKEEWLKWAEGDAPTDGDYYIACDLAGFEQIGAKSSSRLDESAFAVVMVRPSGDWYVEKIVHGRWDLGTTAAQIFELVQKYKPISVGIERGIAQQAVMSPLMDLQRRRNRFFRVELLTHGNKKKVDRIVWSLQGRMEHGRIQLAKGDWNVKFMDQLFQFPSKLTHDDLIDALAYIDQLADVAYPSALMDLDDWEATDTVAGY